MHPFTVEVAVIVNPYGPGVVGVPESSPAVDRVIPAGMAPPVTANVNGPVVPLAVNCCEYGLFAVAAVNAPAAGASVTVGHCTVIEYA